MEQKTTQHPKPHAPASVAALQPLSVGVKDAAQALGLSRSGLYKLINEDKLKCVCIGTRRLILVSELQAFLERSGGGGTA